MQGWVSFIVAASAIAGALSVLWKIVLRPTTHLIGQIAEAVPVMSELVAALGKEDNPFPVLKELLAQTRSDSGSTLKDDLIEIRKGAAADRALLHDALAASAADREADKVDRAIMSGLVDQMTEMTTWRRNQQAGELAVREAASKVVRDNDPSTDLPTVLPHDIT